MNEQERIISYAVTVSDHATGADCSAAMVDSVTAWMKTSIIYRLKAGGRGGRYDVTITITTDNNQQFEDTIRMKVI